MAALLAPLLTRVLPLLLLALAAFGGGIALTHKIDAGELDSLKAQYAANEVAALQKDAAQQQVWNTISAAAAQRQAATQQGITDGLQRQLSAEMPIVKTVSTNCVPYAFVRVLDAAASGRDTSLLSYPAGKSDGSCAPVTWAVVGRSVVANYFTARANEAQLDGLIGVMQDMQKAKQK